MGCLERERRRRQRRNEKVSPPSPVIPPTSPHLGQTEPRSESVGTDLDGTPITGEIPNVPVAGVFPLDAPV